MATINYTSELTEREMFLATMHRNKLFWYLKKNEEMTEKEAHQEMDRIDRRINEIEAFEVRQIHRANKINIARTEASIKGSNELLIMSEV